MAKKRVGIIGSPLERHCIYLAREIENQGAQAVVLNTAPNIPFPLTLEAGLEEVGPDPGSGERGRMVPQSREEYAGIDLWEIGAFFLRVFFLPTPAFDPDVEALKEGGYVEYVAQRERYAAWLSWLKWLSETDRVLVNPVDTLLIHFAKPFQIERLRRAGIPVPRTLVTGDGETVRAFAAEREVVYKPVAGGALCRRLTREDLKPERLERLAGAPVLFQEYIPGEDIRVFVLGDRVIGAFRIEGEGLDYRGGAHRVEAVDIDKDIARASTAACRALGLLFSGVDVKRRPDGSWVILECNPAPMFEGFDTVASPTIVSQVARYLIEAARG
ncbi:ATP-grasp domain-containing protein [Kyrpidia tusciae]|uniref:RimK domain protein ATP-grasp n=1 Tax=Kyrpidia tusciae (strain DSM 2912 / NBRC 15312 / T2) TaxID=562970 RepID=D5WQY7_KYRT2|nr:ATP-grasp domain-containing protein [Kyrpidia tusciae]ADG06746.1 RimK domain protein ATP-grasp [Kyrpidia tusciae DSM 2912]